MEISKEPSYLGLLKIVFTVVSLILLLFVAYNIAVYTNPSDNFEIMAEKSY